MTVTREFVIAGAPPGTASVSVPGWMDMTVGDMRTVLQGGEATARVKVRITNDELSMTGGGGDPGTFKRATRSRQKPVEGVQR